MSSLPVVKVALGVLMKPPPLTWIPLGLATTTSASSPATSVYPFNSLELVPVTSLIMRFADSFFARLSFPSISPAN